MSYVKSGIVPSNPVSVEGGEWCSEFRFFLYLADLNPEDSKSVRNSKACTISPLSGKDFRKPPNPTMFNSRAK